MKWAISKNRWRRLCAQDFHNCLQKAPKRITQGQIHKSMKDSALKRQSKLVKANWTTLPSNQNKYKIKKKKISKLLNKNRFKQSQWKAILPQQIYQQICRRWKPWKFKCLAQLINSHSIKLLLKNKRVLLLPAHPKCLTSFWAANLNKIQIWHIIQSISLLHL